MKEIKWVYIAGRMTNGTGEGFDLKAIHRAMAMHCKLVQRGYVSVCPQLSMFCAFAFPGAVSYEEWLRMDMEFIEGCDVVVRMDGESKGADRECKWAHDLEIEVIPENHVAS